MGALRACGRGLRDDTNRVCVHVDDVQSRTGEQASQGVVRIELRLQRRSLETAHDGRVVINIETRQASNSGQRLRQRLCRQIEPDLGESGKTEEAQEPE